MDGSWKVEKKSTLEMIANGLHVLGQAKSPLSRAIEKSSQVKSKIRRASGIYRIEFNEETQNRLPNGE